VDEVFTVDVLYSGDLRMNTTELALVNKFKEY